MHFLVVGEGAKRDPCQASDITCENRRSSQRPLGDCSEESSCGKKTSLHNVKSYPSPFTSWHNLECVPSLSGVTLQPGGCGIKAGQDDRVDDRSSIDRLSELFNGCKCVVRPNFCDDSGAKLRTQTMREQRDILSGRIPGYYTLVYPSI